MMIYAENISINIILRMIHMINDSFIFSLLKKPSLTQACTNLDKKYLTFSAQTSCNH